MITQLCPGAKCGGAVKSFALMLLFAARYFFPFARIRGIICPTVLTEPPWLGQETGHSHPGLWLSLERIPKRSTPI